MTTRRNLLAGAGALALAGSARTATVTRPGTAFGTTVRLAVTAVDEETANRAIDAGYAEIRAVHKAVSLFDSRSELTRLNATGSLDQPSPRLMEIVTASDGLHRMSGGAFDPSIQALWTLWSSGNPSPGDVSRSLDKVGWSKLLVTPERLSLQGGSELSFNGIAQGYAADRVMHAIRDSGALSAAIDTGEAGRFNADGSIPVQHPRKPAAIGFMKVPTGFIAVSGDYATTFSDDFTQHHIFDPALGVSPRELASVVVVAPSGTMADGLATAFMVMGSAKSLACLRGAAGCAALFVDKAGEILLSPGMATFFQKT